MGVITRLFSGKSGKLIICRGRNCRGIGMVAMAGWGAGRNSGKLIQSSGAFRGILRGLRPSRWFAVTAVLICKDAQMSAKLFSTLTACLLVLSALMPSVSADVEAVRGKKYPLTKKHGPWMVMVASIRDVEEDRRMRDGLSAAEAADELVYQLRLLGIPAYTYQLEEKLGEISSTGDSSSRKFVAQHGYISVLAGNFPSNTDAEAKKVLQYIKTKFRPDFLSDPKNGGILPRTPGRPGPLSRAFLTANPLFEGEIRDGEEEDFMVELNSGQKYSLLQNESRYTLVVATFFGGSVMQVSGSDSTRALGFFERNFGKSLDDCALRAMQLADALRNAKKHGYDQEYEAWVLHEKYRSLVTIGSFDSKDDPRIRQLVTQFAGKPSRDPRTGADVLVGETFAIPKVTRRGQLPQDSWVFDGTPQIREVPRIR
jgi:hypothetical protein